MTRHARALALMFVIAATAPACSAEKGTTSTPSGETTETSTSTTTTASTNGEPAPTIKLPSRESASQAGAQRIRLGDGVPDWLTADGENVWIAGDGVGEGVARMNSHGKLDLTAAVGTVCAAMDIGYGSLWVPSCDDQKVLRIDLATGRVDARIAVPGEGMFPESSVAAGENGVWVLSGTAKPELVRIDPATNKVANTWPMPERAAAVRAGLGSVWVTVNGLPHAQLLQVDPDTGRVSARIRVGLGPRFLTVGAGAVWVMNQADGTVSRVDPQDGTVTATVTVSQYGISGGDIAAADNSVWVRISDPLAVEIDPTTNTAVTQLGPSVESGSVAIGSTDVWFSVEINNSIYRLPIGH